MFVSVTPEKMDGNVFSLIGKDWMLLTAVKEDGTFNSMTASWGGLGVLWGKSVFYCFLRPQRFTHEFSESGTHMSACFFEERYRKQLTHCGRVSGRDTDKVADCGFTPVRHTAGGVYYQEARLVLLGRKLYTDRIRPEGLADSALLKNYPENDFHTMYVYEIEEMLRKETTD